MRYPLHTHPPGLELDPTSAEHSGGCPTKAQPTPCPWRRVCTLALDSHPETKAWTLKLHQSLTLPHAHLLRVQGAELFPDGSVVKEICLQCRRHRRSGFDPWVRKIQYSCLGSPRHRGAWRATVHGVTESDTTEHACMCQGVKGKGDHNFLLGSGWA